MTALHGISPKLAPARRPHVPIRIKITIPYMILALILAGAVAYLTTQLVIENIQERFDKQLYEAGKISSELLVRYETQLLETQRLLANAQGVAEALLADDPEALRSLTLGIVANDRQEAVEFIDNSGNHVLSMHHKLGGNPEEYVLSSGGQSPFTNLEIVQEILARRNDPLGNKFADLVKTADGSILYVSGPVYDLQGNLTGVVLVGRTLATVTAEMRASTFAQISLYDRTGRVLYSTLPFPRELTADAVTRTLAQKD